MTRNLSTWLLASGAFVVMVIAVALGPLRAFVAETILERNIIPPAFMITQPTAIDTRSNTKYLGTYNSGVEHFRNIFYAEDTSGKNRFSPPVPIKPEPGSVIDATKEGSWCPQGTGDIFPFTSRITNISENCLSLRIARPVGTKSHANLPVVLWIHGGGHALGSGSDILYTPDGFISRAVAARQPVIWVAINYRLGLFGFAASNAIFEAKQGNVGLRDQRLAMEWVRDNIRVFGGNPDKVTAIGQSVGASDITIQMTAFDGERGAPFQQAFLMSGSPGLNFNTDSNLVLENTANIAKQAGCVKGNSQSLETLECLRHVPYETLTNLSVTASRTARPPFGEGFFFPTVDGDFLRDRPSELVLAGKIAQGIPIIASWVTNEGAWYASPETRSDEDVLGTFGLWLSRLSEATNKKLLQLYPLKEFEHLVRPDYDGPISPQYYRAAQLNRDLWFTCGVIDFAWQYARKGGVALSDIYLLEHNSTRFTPVFQYMGVPMWRVSHLSDVPYVLNSQSLAGGADNSAAALELSSTVSRSIIQFAVTGDPEGKASKSAWLPAFSQASNIELRQPTYPASFSVQLTGGPYENGPVTVSKGPRKQNGSPAEDAIRWERLVERCEFINSDQVRKETGV